MKAILIIGTGGFIGSVLRYLLSAVIHNKFISAFPYGTLSVNIIGCFVIGLILALAEKGNINADYRIFLVTGMCGGFTTFSAFSAETLGLFRTGETIQGFVYIAASVVLGVLATLLGFTLAKMF